MTREQAQEWVEAYGRAWRQKDAAAAAGLFTADGVYRSHPFRSPHTGRAAIQAYWERATEDQRDLILRFGRPLVDGSRVAVEWWATGGDGDGDFTLPGCLILRFGEGGLCEELREYWHVDPTHIAPHSGWGA